MKVSCQRLNVFRRENEVVFSKEVSCQTQRLHVLRRENEVVFLA